MSLFGPLFGGGGATVVVAPTFPALSNTTTEDLICDRIIAVITAIVPRVLAVNKFNAYRNEGDADFIAWCEANPTGALRRFQVIDDGNDMPPEVSNSDFEERRVTFVITVAYPQNERAGRRQALDRLKAMKFDQRDIEHAIGECGRPNFSPPNPDAVWRAGKTSRVKGSVCDYLVIEQTMAFRSALFG